jgi:hypothetical protein
MADDRKLCQLFKTSSFDVAIISKKIFQKKRTLNFLLLRSICQIEVALIDEVLRYDI